MYNTNLYSFRNRVHRAEDGPIRSIGINGEVLVPNKGGYLDLAKYTLASANTIPELHVHRLLMTSDRRQKQDITPLCNKEADRLVLKTPVHCYNLEGHRAAGFIAQQVPVAYTATHDNILTVDIHTMYAHLWASVQGLLEREQAALSLCNCNKQVNKETKK